MMTARNHVADLAKFRAAGIAEVLITRKGVPISTLNTKSV